MKRSERKDRMRERILTLASEIYLKRGPEAVRMRELAQNVGISSATLYKYFPSKNALSKAVVMRILTRYYNIILNALNDSDLTFPEVLRLIQQLSQRSLKNVSANMIDLIFQKYQDDNEINGLFGSQSDFWRQFVARGRRDGYISDDLSDTAVFIYIDMFFQYFRNPQYVDKFNMTLQRLHEIDHEFDRLFYLGLLGGNDNRGDLVRELNKYLM